MKAILSYHDFQNDTDSQSDRLIDPKDQSEIELQFENPPKATDIK